MTHQRPYIAHVDAHDGQIALPANGVERIEGIGNHGRRAASFDFDAPFPAVALLRAEGVIDTWGVEHAGIEYGVLAEQSFLRELVAGIAGLHQQCGDRFADVDAPHGAAWNHDIVAGGDCQVTEVAKQFAGTAVEEQKIVAVGIACQRRHAARKLPNAHPQRRVSQNVGRQPRRGLRSR